MAALRILYKKGHFYKIENLPITDNLIAYFDRK